MVDFGDLAVALHHVLALLDEITIGGRRLLGAAVALRPHHDARAEGGRPVVAQRQPWEAALAPACRNGSQRAAGRPRARGCRSRHCRRRRDKAEALQRGHGGDRAQEEVSIDGTVGCS